MVVLFSGGIPVASAAAASPAVTPGVCRPVDGEDRPAIGLALGGGGARGISHVSLLRKLEELHIPVDCIAGTSIGSLVGGLYAAGMSVDDMEEMVTSMDWMQLFDDSLERPERSFRRKQDDRSRLATLGIGVRNGKVHVSPGILQGQRILSLFEQKTLAVSAVESFDDLPIPYRATATDLNTGEAVILDHGSLALAMRASMSLPGIFQPVTMDGRVLLDGGLANQVPVDVVRAMGADIVIAVDVGTPLTEFDENASVLEVVSQLTTMMTTRNAADQLGTLSSRDVLIVPALGTDVATGDFAKAAEALAIGTMAAEEAAPRLQPLGLEPSRYERYAALRRQVAPADGLIRFVRFDNTTEYDDRVLFPEAESLIGKPLDVPAMESTILRAYSLGTLSSMTYEISTEDGQAGLVVKARAKTHGPNYVQMGLRSGTDFSGNHDSNLRLALLRAPMTPYGAEGRLIADIGTEPAVTGELYLPLDPHNRYHLFAQAAYKQSTFHLYNPGGDKIATYNLAGPGGEIRLGRELGNYALVSAGVAYSHARADVEVGLPLQRRFDSDNGAWTVRGTVDRLDSLFFPRRGYYTDLTYRASEEWLGSDTDYEQAGVDVLLAHSFGAHSVQAGLAYHATLSGMVPLQERFRLGGRGRLAGFHYNEISGQNYGLVMLGYSYQLAEFFGRSATVGGTVEYGNAWELRRNMSFSSAILNGSLYLGFDSWIGPMMLGYGLREGGNGVLFLELGRPF